MNNTELIRELRALTSAGMKDCKDALEESGWDLQKAVDIVKVKGLNIADGRTGRAASEGRVVIAANDYYQLVTMVEVNCQTDFVANSEDFVSFTTLVGNKLRDLISSGQTFTVDEVENDRKEIVSKTKENVVVRRWWAEQAQHPAVKVFSYLHSNSKIGVLITMRAPSARAANDPQFKSLGEDLAMQVCAMNPIAVSSDRIPADELDRQKAIFETQLKEEGKPEKMWTKIMEGKLNKWYKDVCLVEQDSIVVGPKVSVASVLKTVGAQLGGEIQVINFVRCQVGEGVEKSKDDLAEEVSKMVTRAETINEASARRNDEFVQNVISKMKES